MQAWLMELIKIIKKSLLAQIKFILAINFNKLFKINRMNYQARI